MYNLNVFIFVFGCISAVILGIMSFKSFSEKTLYNLSIVCMIALACMELIFIYMRFYHTNMYVNIALWVVWGTFFAIVVIMDEVFLVGVMAKMTREKNKCRLWEKIPNEIMEIFGFSSYNLLTSKNFLYVKHSNLYSIPMVL